MGLDMYLTRRHYVKNWSFMKPEELHSITVLKGGNPVTAIKPERISEITEQVAYWRKANAIHKWFVDNAQSGNDDCGTYYVDREQLVALRDLCAQVKLDRVNAPQTLPTQGGFFFGSTEYDDCYIQDIEETLEVLTALLAEPQQGDYYYHSSW